MIGILSMEAGKEPALHRDDQLNGPKGAAGQEDLYHDRQFSAQM